MVVVPVVYEWCKHAWCVCVIVLCGVGMQSALCVGCGVVVWCLLAVAYAW
jgi:hypothetical protein